ncbi:MAG: type II toxin-antitoxin system VapC family toxin [Candidatus Sulfotelmatobacter sp.]|jgi:toxin FitB
MSYLLDTNCISEPTRDRPEPRVLSWLDAVDESQLYLSVLTLGEIRKGASALPESRRRSHLEVWLERQVKVRFSGRILPISDDIAERWGWLAAEAKIRGRSLPVIDGLLAATALHHNLVLVSRNITDFLVTRVPILNPWME